MVRDSFYRSPQAFKDAVATAQANRQAQQPELVILREEIAAFKRERKQTARDHAATVRELEETIKIYPNQMQVLALRNAELNADNQRLQAQLARADAAVIPLRQSPPVPSHED